MNNLHSFQYTKKDLLLHAVCFTIYGIVKYIPSPCGDFLRYAVLKPFCKKLGSVRIYEGVTVRYPYYLEVGDKVSLNEWVYLDAPGGIEIGNNVRIGHRTSIITSTHNHERLDIPIHDQGLSAGKVTIGDGVWIGCNVAILAGVTIGEHSIIGANSVVTRDVPPYSLAVGCPAKARPRSSEKTSSRNDK